MLFYKAELKFSKPFPKKKVPARNDDFTEAVSLGTVSFNESVSDRAAVFAAYMEPTKLRIGIVQKKLEKLDVEKLAADYGKSIGCAGEIVSCEEITHREFNFLVNRSARYSFIGDEDDYLEKNGLPAENRRRRMRSEEKLLPCAYTREKAERRAKELLCPESFLSEIERIFSAVSPNGFRGHPVHYILVSDSDEAAETMRELLLCALVKADRLAGRRCCMVFLEPDKQMDEAELADMYRSLAGGTAVVRLMQPAENGRHANALHELMPALIRTIEKHRRDVLTVVECRRQDEKLARMFLEGIQGVTFVWLCEETVFRADAKKYLRRRADAAGVKDCKKLYARLGDGEKGFMRSDLDRLFEDWYDKYLRVDLYPQYASMTAVRAEKVRQVRGSAIDELNAMTGLAEPKRIIAEAIDYHKAQKLFSDKGFSNISPAMHMVFSGNPGTAKTTVARLFAQIMKDNGVLSVGKLIEVGRSDLVGKYVGWTAQIVKDKFAAAKGSVLFIDEAYSLVEERGGLYGDEAINTIVQEIENAREDTVVIFAGYPDKMIEFISRNPGLKSRIAFHVNFPDYSADELMAIFSNLLKSGGREAGDAVLIKVRGILEASVACSDFGNGRYVRTLIERASIRQAARLMHMDPDTVTKKDAVTLLAEDFTVPSLVNGARRCEIGF